MTFDPASQESFSARCRRLWLAAGIAVFAFAVASFLTPAVFAQAAEPTGEAQSLWDALADSGAVGLVIILCSIAGFSLTIAFAIQIRRDYLVPPDLLEHLESLFEDEDYEEALHACEAQPSFLSAVVSSGLERIDEGYEAMSDAMAEASEIEATKLHQKVGYLSLIASVSPMLGLLGTVQGMIGAFGTLANSAVQPKPKDLAADISLALGTTFLGLCVAIPMTAVFVFFRNRVINIVNEVGSVAEEMLGRFKSA
ncbi:MAG TPA: MotA/TolQ/ExbB proton channel family protein [Planctomycetota bacterium]|nr:MotA/TolQ/ExbB proton channel family protein [Planctomycetota bacterium]